MISVRQWVAQVLALLLNVSAWPLSGLLSTNLESNNYTLHILDDFLIIARTAGLCEAQLTLFLHFCKDLGVPMAPKETIGPKPVLSFAGIELDTCKSEACLP